MTLLKRIGISWGLQAVNIISNREEDLSRGVDFFPDGWKLKEMFLYARRNLVLADAYMESIKPSPILDFCKIPLTLAQATLDALSVGDTKLSRTAITELVRRTTGE
jgi:farnesyl-diphosphate farnesyltransferase